MALPIARMAAMKQCANAFHSNVRRINSDALMALVLTKRPSVMGPKIVMTIQVNLSVTWSLKTFSWNQKFDYLLFRYFSCADELSEKCLPDNDEKKRGRCSADEFQCRSGECIPIDNLCDGTKGELLIKSKMLCNRMIQADNLYFRMSRFVRWNGRVLRFKVLPAIWIPMRLRCLCWWKGTVRWTRRLLGRFRWELFAVWLSRDWQTDAIDDNNLNNKTGIRSE